MIRDDGCRGDRFTAVKSVAGQQRLQEEKPLLLQQLKVRRHACMSRGQLCGKRPLVSPAACACKRPFTACQNSSALDSYVDLVF